MCVTSASHLRIVGCVWQLRDPGGGRVCLAMSACGGCGWRYYLHCSEQPHWGATWMPAAGSAFDTPLVYNFD